MSLPARVAAMALLLAGSASAAPDDFGLGDGHSGALVVLDAGVVLNASAVLAADAGAGTQALRVSPDAGFSDGDLAFVYQASDAFAFDSGTAGPFDLTLTGAGRFELARVLFADAGTLLLAAPLTLSFPAGLAQVVRVPEYTSVYVGDAGSV